MTSSRSDGPTDPALRAQIRPGRDLTGYPIMVVWVRLDLGAGPEWVAVGTVRGGWR